MNTVRDIQQEIESAGYIYEHNVRKQTHLAKKEIGDMSLKDFRKEFLSSLKHVSVLEEYVVYNIENPVKFGVIKFKIPENF